MAFVLLPGDNLRANSVAMASLDQLLCSSSTDNLVLSLMSTEVATRTHTRRCSVPECKKTAKRGGRCIAHGGGNKCSVDGCTTSVVSRGLCVAHGGGKRCQTPDCSKSAQSGGFCWVHGGGKKCGYQGCLKRAQSGGACIAHGGGKRCKIQDCNKVVQYDGLCVGHGGYRRCVSVNCEKRAMANDYCQQHGGSSVCLLELCYKRAVRGGMCSQHKARTNRQASASIDGTTSPSQSSDEGSDHSEHSYKSEAIVMPGWTQWPSPIRTTDDALDDVRSPTWSEDRSYENGAVSPPFERIGRKNSSTPSGLLDEDVILPAFSVVVEKIESSRSDEHKVYPVLPGIQVLQSFCGKKSPCSGDDSELRVIAKENADVVSIVEPKFYVDSYYRQAERTHDDWSLMLS